MSDLFASDWETGTGLQCTGGAGAWDSVSGGDAAKFYEDLSSLIFDTACARYADTGAARYLAKTVTGTGATGVRLALKWNSSSLTAGDKRWFFLGRTGASANLLAVYLSLVGSTPTVIVEAVCGGTTWRQAAAFAVDLATAYQLVVKWQKNTAGGCSAILYAEDGTTVAGIESALSGSYTTSNADFAVIRVGVPQSDAYARATDFAFDSVLVTDTYAYPATISAGTSTVTSDLAIPFDIRAFVTSDLAIPYDIRNSVISDLQVRFDILNTVTSDLAIPYDIHGTVEGDLEVVFDVRGMVGSDLQAVYDMAGVVFADLEVVYSIMGGTLRARIIGSSFRGLIQ